MILTPTTATATTATTAIAPTAAAAATTTEAGHLSKARINLLFGLLEDIDKITRLLLV